MKRTKRSSRNDFANLLDGIFNVDIPRFINDLPNNNKHVPPVNILEKEDQFIVEVAVPGVEKEAINVEINDNMLTISKENVEASKENEGTESSVKYTRKEFSFNSFKRTFTLPETIDSNLISASNNNGILSIVLPKKEEAKAVKKNITIA